MAGFGSRAEILNQETRAKLLSLLLQGEAADPLAWREFWQTISGLRNAADGKDLEVLASVFEEGLSQIASTGPDSEALIATWIKEVLKAAHRRGADEAEFSERLLVQQLFKQVGQRDHGRQNSSDTHQKILVAALEVFSTKGFHGATVDEIAERAELGKGTVYRHFKSKKGLFSELIRLKVAELEQEVRRTIDPQADVLEIIEIYLRVYFGFFDRNRNLYRVLIQEQSDFGAEVKALYIGNILKKVPLLRRKIYLAARDGRLKQMDFHTVFYGVMGFIDGVMQKWLASDGGYSLVDEVPTVLQTVFYGFVNTETTGRSTGSQLG
jgi:AcrR family transcriptional regulator